MNFTKEDIVNWYNQNGFTKAAEHIDDILAEYNNLPSLLGHTIKVTKDDPKKLYDLEFKRVKHPASWVTPQYEGYYKD